MKNKVVFLGLLLICIVVPVRHADAGILRFVGRTAKHVGLSVAHGAECFGRGAWKVIY